MEGAPRALLGSLLIFCRRLRLSEDVPANSAAPSPEADLCAGSWLGGGKWRGMSNMVNANRVDSVVTLSNNPTEAVTSVSEISACFTFLPGYL
jgi:hypothetical protein